MEWGVGMSSQSSQAEQSLEGAMGQESGVGAQETGG